MINHIKIVITMSSLCDQNAAILCKINNGLLTQLTQHLLFFVILWLVLHDNALMRLLKTIHARQVKRKRASDCDSQKDVCQYHVHAQTARQNTVQFIFFQKSMAYWSL